MQDRKEAEFRWSRKQWAALSACSRKFWGLSFFSCVPVFLIQIRGASRLLKYSETRNSDFQSDPSYGHPARWLCSQDGRSTRQAGCLHYLPARISTVC